MAPNNLPGLLSRLAVAAALFVGIPTGLLAQGSEEQREACTPDAFRLCTSAMPDAGRVENCLRNAGPRLSPACYAVFFPPALPDQVQAARGQGASPRTSMSAHARGAPTSQMRAVPRRGDNDDND